MKPAPGQGQVPETQPYPASLIFPEPFFTLPEASEDAQRHYLEAMICPACKCNLREKTASGLTLDVCYGGCGGIWFDRNELERIDARGAAALHTIWRDPCLAVEKTEPRVCPRCPGQILDRRWFSELKLVQIDTCPSCEGIWLDEGEFTAVHQEIDGAKITTSCWQAAMEAATMIPPASAPVADEFLPVFQLESPEISERAT